MEKIVMGGGAKEARNNMANTPKANRTSAAQAAARSGIAAAAAEKAASAAHRGWVTPPDAERAGCNNNNSLDCPLTLPPR